MNVLALNKELLLTQDDGTVAKVDLPNLKGINEWSPTSRVRKVRGSSSISSQKLVLSSFCSYVVLFGVRVLLFNRALRDLMVFLVEIACALFVIPFSMSCLALMIVFYRRRRSMVAFGGGSCPAGWFSE
jgi:hypothetical protein